MNDPLSPLADELPEASHGGLSSEIRTLRTMLHVTLVALIVVSGSLSVVLLRQVLGMRRQVREMTTVVLNYEKNEVPVLEDFRKKLDDFARRDPNFRPILAKYFTPDGGAQPAPSGAVAPAPAPAAPPRK